VEVGVYPRSRLEPAARKFVDVQPDLILIATELPSVAVECVRALRAAVPAWIAVCTSITDEAVRMDLIRFGAFQLLSPPVTSENLAQILRQVQLLDEMLEARERARKAESMRGELYSVCAGKRGAGATTIAINIAASLAEVPNSKVALIDLDWPIGDVSSYLNIAARFNISDALSAAERLDSVLLESYLHRCEQIQVLTGWEQIEQIESGKLLTPDTLTALLTVMQQTFTHTVIDFSLVHDPLLVQTVARMSTCVLAVITPEIPSLRRAERFLRFVSGGEEAIIADRIRLILNRTTKTDEITDRDIQNALHHPVSWKIANDYRTCKEAIHSGKTLLSTKLGRHFRDIARQLIEPEAEDQRKGLSLLPKPSVV